VEGSSRSRCSRIVSFNCSENIFDFFGALLRATGLRQGEGAELGDASLECAEELMQDRVSRTDEEHVVNGVLCVENRTILVSAFNGRRNLFDCCAKFLTLFVGRVLCEQLGGEALELCSHSIDVARKFGARDRHNRSPTVLGFHEALGFKLAQGLTNRRPARRGHFAQLSLNQKLPRWKPKLDDRVTQNARNLLADRCVALDLPATEYVCHVATLSVGNSENQDGETRSRISLADISSPHEVNVLPKVSYSCQGVVGQAIVKLGFRKNTQGRGLKMGSDSIAVIGAGPVGLIAALAFARDGFDVTVFEAEDQVNLAPRAMVYLNPLLPDLHELGILDDMKNRGHIDREGFNMHLVALNEVLSAPNSVLDGLMPTPFNVHLGQGQVCTIVLEHLGRLPNVEVRWGHSLVGLEQSDSGVTLTVQKKGGTTTTARYGWVIGADGGRSAVRELIGATAEGMTWDDRFVATNVFADFRSLGMKSSNMYVHPTLAAVIADIDGHGLWRCTFQESADLPEEGLRQRIDDYYHALLGEDGVYEIDAYSPYRMHQRMSTKMHEGRVVLAGDAAHLTNPTGGLGLTTGLYDVISLREGLGALIAGEADESVLDRYAAERTKAFTEISSPTAVFLKDVVYGRHPAETLRTLTEPMRQSTQDIESQRQMLLGLDAVRSPSLLLTDNSSAGSRALSHPAD